MSNLNKDMVMQDFKEIVKSNLEAIVKLSEEIKRHENNLLLGEWFNLKTFCSNHVIGLGELYKSANQYCKWEETE